MARFIRVASVSDIPPGTMRSFEVLYDRILIVNWQGTFFATQDLCTHDDGSLADGTLVDGQIECPRHGGRFDPATGAATRMPAMFPIKTFPVKVEGESIWVAV